MNPSTRLLVNSLAINPPNSIGLNGLNDSGKFKIAEYLCAKALNMQPGDFNFRVKAINCMEDIGIDDVRALKKELSVKSVGQDNFRRAVIFKNFHKMSTPAQNSILKLLEEPPVDTLLIILVDSKNSILPTIVSRLQWIDVLPLDLATLEQNYSSHSKSLVKQAFLLSDGYIESFEKNINDENTPIKSAINDAKKILKMKRVERVSSVERVINSQDYTPEDFLNALQKIYLTLVRREADSAVSAKILFGLEYVIKTKESLKYNSNPKLIFTNLFYKI